MISQLYIHDKGICVYFPAVTYIARIKPLQDMSFGFYFCSIEIGWTQVYDFEHIYRDHKANENATANETKGQ